MAPAHVIPAATHPAGGSQSSSKQPRARLDAEEETAGRGGGEALTPRGVVGHAERGDAVGALDVEHVEVLRVGDVAVVAAVGEALQDLPRHGARVAARRAVLRQHHRAARHHGVLDPAHCRSDPDPDPLPARPPGPLARRKRGEGREGIETEEKGWE